jgi:predicted nucleotidyltransferase
MAAETLHSRRLRRALASHRPALVDVLARYNARNPRLFGSVARGEAGADSDIDVLVDLDPDSGNELLRVAGIGEEFSRILGVRVDVVADALLREPVAESVLHEAVAL